MTRCGPIVWPDAHPRAALVRSKWRSIPWSRCWSLQHTGTFYLLLHSLGVSKLFLKGTRKMQTDFSRTAQLLYWLGHLPPSWIKHKPLVVFNRDSLPKYSFFSSNNFLLTVLQARVSVFIFYCPQWLFLPWDFPAAFLNPWKWCQPHPLVMKTCTTWVWTVRRAIRSWSPRLSLTSLTWWKLQPC